MTENISTRVLRKEINEAIRHCYVTMREIILCYYPRRTELGETRLAAVKVKCETIKELLLHQSCQTDCVQMEKLQTFVTNPGMPKSKTTPKMMRGKSLRGHWGIYTTKGLDLTFANDNNGVLVLHGSNAWSSKKDTSACLRFAKVHLRRFLCWIKLK